MNAKYDAEYAAQMSRFLDDEIGPPLYTAPFSLTDDDTTETLLTQN